MILVVTNSDDKTADYLLERLPQTFFRFDTDRFLSDYKLNYTSDEFWIQEKCSTSQVNTENLRGILYRRPVNPRIRLEDNQNLESSLSMEARLLYEHSLSSLDTKWMSHPASLRNAENKIIQLKIARTAGFRIPRTIVTNSCSELASFMKHRDTDYCVKPVYLGLFEKGEYSYIPYNRKIEKAQDYLLIDDFPALVQEYIEKAYELRIIVIGQSIHAVRIDSQENEDTREDWRVNNCLSVRYSPIKLPPNIAKQCLKMLELFDISFCSMDLVFSKGGDYVFLDLNPNGQWAWIDEMLDLNLAVEFSRFFCE